MAKIDLNAVDDRGWPKKNIPVNPWSHHRDNRQDPGPAAVVCRGNAIDQATGVKGIHMLGSCGLVFLTYEQYTYQLSRPNSGWSCPRCGSSAEWDDYCRETNPPE
jgi:hypothetical protein